MTDPDRIRRLMSDLARPIYNFRMATGMAHAGVESQRRGAEKRLKNATEEIDELVRAYVRETE